MPLLLHVLLELGAPHPGLGPDHHREHVPGRVDALRRPGEVEHVWALREPLDESIEVALSPGQVLGELLQLHHAERSGQLGGLEVPTHLVEDEQIVVLEVAVDLREEPRPAPLLGAEQLDLRTSSPTSEEQAAIGQIRSRRRRPCRRCRRR